jgi:hypothetical protein
VQLITWCDAASRAMQIIEAEQLVEGDNVVSRQRETFLL